MKTRINPKTFLISVHLPKTAGTSFGFALEGVFGNRLLRDYGDAPLESKFRNPETVPLKYLVFADCIHGHFMPIKYLRGVDDDLGPANVAFVTWMRNPIDRIISHYHYWRRNYGRELALPMRREMNENNWSLERFCLGPELRNLYTRYLSGVPVGEFSFIGITEHYEEDFNYFSSEFLSRDLRFDKLNVANIQGRYDITESFRKEIERVHSSDMFLYSKALKLRNTRSD